MPFAARGLLLTGAQLYGVGAVCRSQVIGATA